MDLKQIALVTLQTPSSVWEIATLSLHFSSGDCLLVSSFLSHRTARRQVRVTARRGQVTRRIEPQPPLLGAAGSADARLPPVAAPAGRHAGCAGGVNLARVRPATFLTPGRNASAIPHRPDVLAPVSSTTCQNALTRPERGHQAPSCRQLSNSSEQPSLFDGHFLQ